MTSKKTTTKKKSCKYRRPIKKENRVQTKEVKKVIRKIDEGIFRNKKRDRHRRKLKTDEKLSELEAILANLKPEELKARKESLEMLENFIKTNSQGIITLPNGKQRDLRAEFDYADESLSVFDDIGLDKKANMEILNQNVTFMVWRAVHFQTDMDTKDILIKPEVARMTGINRAFVSLLNVATQNEFKLSHFGTFLNTMRGEALKYGTTIVKVANGKTEVVNWDDIVAYGWTDVGDKPRIAHRIVISLDEAIRRFEGKESFDIVKAEVDWLRTQGVPTISFVEYWDSHLIDGEYKDSAVLYLNRENLLNMENNQRYQITGNEEVYIEIDRYVSDYKRELHGEEILQRPFFELTFINPTPNICRIGFGIPKLIEAIQKEWTEKAHLKRKADRLAYKSVWIHKRNEGADVEDNIRTQMSEGIETGALLEINPTEELERLTISSPLENFLADVQYLESVALKLVGVAELRANEQSARKTATQVEAEVGREMSSINYFIEQQGLMLEEMLLVYLKEVILRLTERDIMLLSGSPKDIRKIRQMLFSVHYREHYKALNRKFKKITGEDPWLSDIDNIYKALDKDLTNTYGEGSLPFKFKKWKKLILQNLDFAVDVDVTTENNVDRQMLDVYKYMLQLAQADPRLDKEKITQKMIATFPNSSDISLYKSDEEMQKEIDQQIINQAKVKVADQTAQQVAEQSNQAQEEIPPTEMPVA